MSKVQIKLDYNNKVYISDEVEATQEEIEQINEVIEKTTKGELSYLSIKSGNEEHYFSEYILNRSIISVIVK